jgi:hypothetical protein
MTRMEPPSTEYSSADQPRKQETLYYCKEHGVMNKSIDLKEKVDQIAGRI